jgi:hypothetical protein
MPAAVETATQNFSESFVQVKSTPILNRQDGWRRPKRSSLSGCSTAVATLYGVEHERPTDKLHEDKTQQKVINYYTDASMYSLERWLTEGEEPWNPLGPHENICWDT